jgi:HAD superfamily hydrolase (TIGR01509 family)
MTFRAIIFDWDGTLVDTAEATFHCYRRTLAEYGIELDRDAFGRAYAPSGDDMFRAVGLPDHHWPEAHVRWVDNFLGQSFPLLPGARESIQLVGERNLIAGIVTGGTRRRVVAELASHELDLHFTHVICGDDIANKKPHPEPLLRCLADLGVAADEAAYIGDSPEDIEMARASGVYAVGVPGPYPNRDGLRAAKPDLLAADVLEAVRSLVDRSGETPAGQV